MSLMLCYYNEFEYNDDKQFEMHNRAAALIKRSTVFKKTQYLDGWLRDQEICNDT